MKSYYARFDRLKDTILLDYLYGEDIKILPPDDRLVDFGERIPKLASPIAAYLLEVWSFISAYNLDWKAHLESPAKAEWLDTQLANCNLKSSLQDIWERLAITGEVCLVALPYTGLTYKVKQFEYSEFKPVWDSLDDLEAIHVRSVSGDYSYRLDVTREYYRVYDKVSLEFTGEPSYTDYPHTYGFVPAVVLQNNRSLTNEGYPDFDETSIDLAIELIRQTSYPAINYKYFSRPWIISPDPKETRKAIVKRDVVLQSESSEDGGNPTALEFNPVPQNLYDYLDTLTRNFYQQQGLSYVKEFKGIATASSLALKMIYAQSLRTSEDKLNLLGSSIASFLSLMLRMAAKDGILLDVFLNDELTYRVDWFKTGDPFPVSPQEKLASLSIASQLRDLGITPEVALKEFYTSMTPEEILSLMEPT